MDRLRIDRCYSGSTSMRATDPINLDSAETGCPKVRRILKQEYARLATRTQIKAKLADHKNLADS